MFDHIFKSTFILIALLSILSCARSEVSSSTTNRDVIQDVPFVKQKYRFCGPAALTSVMRYYGHDIDQDDIADEVYTPELRGSLISDMNHYAESEGLRAVTENESLDKVVMLIEQNVPVILLVDKGRLGVNIQHYYVVYGHDSDTESFIIHDGIKNGRVISRAKLDAQWKKMNRLMLVITDEN